MKDRVLPPDDRDTPPRGQTTIDFAIGISIFLMTTTFVLMFTMSTFTPLFSPADTGEKVRAERTSKAVVNQYIGSDSPAQQPVVVNKTCMDAFFRGNDAGGCPYEGRPLNQTFGLKPTDNLYISVTYMNGTAATYNETTLVRGTPPDAQASPAVKTRMVVWNRTTYRLNVWLW